MKLKIILSITILLLLIGETVFSQSTGYGGGYFLQGRYLEIGVSATGSLGVESPPSGYHPDPTSALASVYDYGHDGWSTGTPAYFGDYTWPGSPYEGWEVQINSTDRTQAFIPTSLSTTGSVSPITATHIDSPLDNSGILSTLCTGSGTYSGLSIAQTTSIDTNGSCIKFNVVFKNTSTTTIPDIYYLRTLDPDNDETHSGDYATDNTITYQNDSEHRVLASSTGTVYTDAYLGLGTKDSRAKAFIYTSWPLSITQDLSSIWTDDSVVGSSSEFTEGGTLDGDYAMGLIFKIGDLAPGDSATIIYAYVYNGVSGLDSAIASDTYDSTIAVGTCMVDSISGAGIVCTGDSLALTDSTPGGTWSLSNATASIDTSGILYGITAGNDTVYYTVTSTCGTATASAVITVNTPPSVTSIYGSDTICVGSATYLYDSASAGVWSASNGNAVIDSTGTLTGITPGADTISYTVSNVCGGVSATLTVTVDSILTASAITGTDTMFTGGTYLLTDSTAGGNWSSSDSTIASVSATGIVTAVSAGAVTITYSVPSCDSASNATAAIIVLPLNGISGNIFFDSTAFSGNINVWLITYDTASTIITAIDSEVVTCSGSSVYYQFTDVPGNFYRIKAAVSGDSLYAYTGYAPTYHTSSLHWDTATVLYHSYGTSDTGQDISMLYGTVSPGPGFIAGSVTTGAGRTTATAGVTGVPASGMLILLTSAGGTLVQHTYTDSMGKYSFSDLAAGNYIVYPEQLSYYTTPYTGITIGSPSDTANGVDFVQRMGAHTITPVANSTANITAGNYTTIFPNPAHDQLIITSDRDINDVVISNIQGQQLIHLEGQNKQMRADISSLAPGVYFIKVNDATVRKFVKE